MYSMVSFDFEAPSNLQAIRANLIRRLQQRKQQQRLKLAELDTPSSVTTTLLAHGLPSPPVEYQKKKSSEGGAVEDDDVLSTISSLPPNEEVITTTAAVQPLPQDNPVPMASCSSPSSTCLSSHELEQKLAQLRDEKRRMFTQLKAMLRQQELAAKKQQQKLQLQQLQHQQQQVSRPASTNTPAAALPSPSPSPSPTSTSSHCIDKLEHASWKKPVFPPARSNSFSSSKDVRSRYQYHPASASAASLQARRHSHLMSRPSLSSGDVPMYRPSRHRSRLSMTDAPHPRY
ncbi:hypothetical protein BC940DRAFT_288089 [Gongronella butleri]|nr:hypothetical protein BC940DRAFT_288089 [Gongronella butleri]